MYIVPPGVRCTTNATFSYLFRSIGICLQVEIQNNENVQKEYSIEISSKDLTNNGLAVSHIVSGRDTAVISFAATIVTGAAPFYRSILNEYARCYKTDWGNSLNGSGTLIGTYCQSLDSAI
jgi:hypothetical protein